MFSYFALLIFTLAAGCRNGPDPYAAHTKVEDKMPAISIDGTSGAFSLPRQARWLW
jgi:hypothetical protein